MYSSVKKDVQWGQATEGSVVLSIGRREEICNGGLIWLLENESKAGGRVEDICLPCQHVCLASFDHQASKPEVSRYLHRKAPVSSA